jgi:hypothetical protein
MSGFKLHSILPAYEMTFANEDGIVAKLKWDKGVLTHEGNMDESAEIFLDLLNVKGLTQYNEMSHKINQLEKELSSTKTQNEIYRKALADK